MKKTISISIIGVVGIILCIYFFEDSDKTLPNYATVIGTICSIVGLSIAYINILALKEESIIISKQIHLTLEKVNQLNSLSEISKAIKVNQEIQEFLRNEKIELARLRTLDLKYMLLHFNNDLLLNELTSDEEYKKLILDFGIDLNSLNETLINSKRKVDFTKVVKNLEELSTYLTKFELKLKSIKI
ncbi:hypothetical protein [Algoriphagus mannitolivorans]|uniref:hypothetical protein n=1 Tax=Algoriphagus mannitolivorans TaxID=226504 RepID=UPI0004793926|nr:hypothetical protein [Algoriphagus mannitolivorans]